MNVKSVLGSYLGHLAGYVLAGADIVSKVNPTLLPPQYGILISVAGLVTVAAHHGYAAGTSGVQSAVDAATKALTSAPAKVAAMLLLAVAVPLVGGCATAPNAQQSAGITVAVDIATAAAIQNGVQPAEYKTRAANFKSIAVTVKAVNDAGTATLATLAADLEPQISKLPPPDQLAAHALVAALKPYLDAELQGNDGLKNVQTTLDVILQAVIDSCAAYGA
jgi:hypothetical protein